GMGRARLRGLLRDDEPVGACYRSGCRVKCRSRRSRSSRRNMLATELSRHCSGRGDGHPEETVLMRYRDGRRSFCLSSQSECPLTCTFCATGTRGYPVPTTPAHRQPTNEIAPLAGSATVLPPPRLEPTIFSRVARIELGRKCVRSQ